MPTEVGPFFLSAAFHFSAMTSNAFVPGHRLELAVLVVDLPFFLRSKRLGQRSLPYMILARK